MNEIITLTLFVTIFTSLANSFFHYREYKKVYFSLLERKVALETSAPTMFSGGTSWGFRFKLADIENYIGIENLTEYEKNHIAASRRAHNIAISVFVLPVVLLVIYAAI